MGWRDLLSRRTTTTGYTQPAAPPPPPPPPASAPGSDSQATLDAYFALLDKHQAAHSARDYAGLRDICAATAKLLPSAVDAFWADHTWHRADPDTGATVAVPPSIPALADLGHLAAAYQDPDLLQLLSDTLEARPDLSVHSDVLPRTELHLRLTGEVLGLVAAEPGIVQSTLGSRLG